MPPRQPDDAKLDRIVAEARRAAAQREAGYRERALKMYSWVCGRCGREFTRANVRELTVHHRNHNHDDNPADGSNWELLCVYCHDNEHARFIDHVRGAGYELAAPASAPATSNPFADLRAMLAARDKG
ncbi:MAG: HNH nuclease family protein [Rhodanobacter sp.]|nr:MAG: HNH nuclease family protein [Rhodanobacter sp.]TAM12005.1 MAG: HNH nuclease family protein [Rhodanobacter sp.]TAM34654.1 MAG: HNH nuclease family protein [Rhodanobacter sp.]